MKLLTPALFAIVMLASIAPSFAYGWHHHHHHHRHHHHAGIVVKL